MNVTKSFSSSKPHSQHISFTFTSSTRFAKFSGSKRQTGLKFSPCPLVGLANFTHVGWRISTSPRRLLVNCIIWQDIHLGCPPPTRFTRPGLKAQLSFTGITLTVTTQERESQQEKIRRAPPPPPPPPSLLTHPSPPLPRLPNSSPQPLWRR